MSCSKGVEYFMNMNNSPSNTEKVSNQNKLVAVLISVVIFALVNLVLGPFLWNEVARKLMPFCGKARWFDTVALSLLLGLLLPQ